MSLGLFAIAIAIIVNALILRKELIVAVSPELQSAVEELVAEVEDTNGKLDSALTFIRGLPDVVAAAVADALAQNNVDEAAAAASVDAARQTLSDKSDEIEAAISAGAPADDGAAAGDEG